MHKSDSVIPSMNPFTRSSKIQRSPPPKSSKVYQFGASSQQSESGSSQTTAKSVLSSSSAGGTLPGSTPTGEVNVISPHQEETEEIEVSPCVSPEARETSMHCDLASKNLFLNLSDDDTGDGDNANQSATAPPAAPPKSIAPPPIIMSDKAVNAENIINTLRNKYSGSISLTFMSVGIKITPKTMRIYNIILRAFKEAKIEYFTHDVKSNTPKKFIIGGLPNIGGAESEIKAELSRVYGLHPLEVNRILPKEKRHAFDCLYTVSFDRGKVTLAELKKITTLCSTIISWDHHRPAARGITQCYNCYLFGHGARNCKMPTRCRVCAGSHKEKNCGSGTQPKCRNCHGSHPANDSSCPSRAGFVEMRSKLGGGKKTRRKASAVKRKTGNTHQLQDPALAAASIPTPGNQHLRTEDFPPLPSTSHQGVNSSTSAAIRPSPPVPVAFSATTGSSNNSTEDNRPIQQALQDQPGRSSESQPSDLFSSQELLCISTELLTGLRGCKSKHDQLQVLFNITLKYLNVNDD